MSLPLEAAEPRTSPVRVGLLHLHGLMRETLARVLEENGVSVTARDRDAESFVAHVRSDPPDVAVLDLQAAGAALSLIDALHREQPATRLLVLSSGADAATVGKWHRAGAMGYLDKMVHGCSAVVSAVGELARGHDYFPAEEATPAPAALAPEAELFALSTREAEVLTHLGTGVSNAEIAQLLGIRVRTVKAHVSSLYRKLGQENRTQLALLARRLRLQPAGPARRG